MNQEDTTYELIDQYLQGALPEDHPFVQRLQQDEDLALEVEVRRSIQEAVVDYRLLEVEKLLVTKTKSLKENGPSYWKPLLLTLPLLLAGAFAYVYLSPAKEKNVIQTEATSQAVPEMPVPLQEEAKQETTLKETAPLSPKKKTLNTVEKESKKELIVEVPAVLEAPKPISFSPLHSKPVMVSQSKEEVPVPHKEATAAIPNPCIGIRLKAFIEEKRPCMGTSQGQLEVKQVRGGKAPYQYSLDGTSFQEESQFTGLKSGEYTLVMKDANQCETVVYENYSLRSKNCTSFSEQVFNPTVGPWEVPNSRENSGTFTVFDLNGQASYIKTFEKGEKVSWGGTQNSGELLVPGAYIYSIKYFDGEMEQGKITITY